MSMLGTIFSEHGMDTSIIAHVAKNTKPPELLARVILTGHLLRALAREESSKGYIDPDSEFSVKTMGQKINYFRPMPRYTATRQQWERDGEEFMERACQMFIDCSRLAELDKKTNVIADIGLRFMLQLIIMDTKSRDNFVYPLYATDAFLTLGVAREIIKDINLETRNLANTNITENIEFEPLSNVDYFYNDMRRRIPHDLRMREADPDTIHEAVIHLADLADKLQRFSQRVYQGRSEMPHLGFREREGVSLLFLRDLLLPYKEGRDAAIKASKLQSSEDTQILPFAPPRKRGDGIIWNNTPPAPSNA